MAGHLSKFLPQSTQSKGRQRPLPVFLQAVSSSICFQIHAKPTSLQVSFQVPDIYDTSGQRDIQQIDLNIQLNRASVHQDAPQHMQ